MTASNDPEVFLTQIDDAIDAVEGALNEFLEASTTAFNVAIASIQSVPSGIWGGIKGGVKGLVTGGIPGAVVGAGQGAGEAYVKELIDRLNEGAELINAEWRDASATIRQAIGSMTGDPLKMSSISSHYRETIDVLGQVRTEVEAANSYVAASWTGRAHIAYTNTSGNQLAALTGVIATLDDSAQLLDDHSTQMVQFWTQQLQNLVDLAADVTKEAAAIGDVGNWATAGAGVVISLIATAASGASKVLTDTASYWADVNISKAGDWDGIQSMLGERGLEGDQWPDFTSLDGNQINQPWEKA